jgi:acyl-CoA thioesterase I
MVLAADYSRMQTLITEVAQQERIGLFSRFALMRKSIDAGLAPDALVSWDRLHNSGEGYDCIGRALARTILASTALNEVTAGSANRLPEIDRRGRPAR